jgi:hypothetical protein
VGPSDDDTNYAAPGEPAESEEQPATGRQRSPSKEERAEQLARQVGRDNPDRTTRREAIEQALEAEGLSEEGEELGQHNE